MSADGGKVQPVAGRLNKSTPHRIATFQHSPLMKRFFFRRAALAIMQNLPALEILFVAHQDSAIGVHPRPPDERSQSDIRPAERLLASWQKMAADSSDPESDRTFRCNLDRHASKWQNASIDLNRARGPLL